SEGSWADPDPGIPAAPAADPLPGAFGAGEEPSYGTGALDAPAVASWDAEPYDPAVPDGPDLEAYADGAYDHEDPDLDPDPVDAGTDLDGPPDPDLDLGP
ncbi:MAG: hypothetical protein ACRDXB_01900, partial [Actinomycetes bacterium]